MRRCIVHFGMPKTGSSSIQATIFGHPGDQRLRYLHGGSANGSGMLATAFMANPSRFHVNRKLGLSEDEVEARRAQLLAGLERQLEQPADLYLLSGESLSNFRIADLRNLVRWLDRRFDSVRAVGYIRPPRGFMESAFQQSVKTADSDLEFAQLYPLYRQRFEPMEKTFGPERVQYWKFDPAAFPNGDVVTDFAQRIGVDLNGIPIQRVNEGLSRDAVALLYCFRLYGPGFGSGAGALVVNGLLHRAVATLGGAKLRFADSAVRGVIESQREDMDWIEQRLGQTLAEPAQEGDGCLHDASELRCPSPEASQWLAERVGTSWRPDPSPQQIAEWMTRLRDLLAAEREAQRDARRLRRTRNEDQAPETTAPAPRQVRRDRPETVTEQAPVTAMQPAPANRQLTRDELLALVRTQLGDDAPGRRVMERTVDALLAALRANLVQRNGRPLQIDGLGTLRATELNVQRLERTTDGDAQ